MTKKVVGAIADEGDDEILGQSGETARLQRRVHGIGEVESAVDEGAVEVEDPETKAGEVQGKKT
jgi:hypothetical protein